MRVILFLFLPLFLFASKAMVSLEIDRGQEFFVSKKFIAIVKVKTTAFSISDLDVDFGDNKDFIFVAPESAAYISSETIGEETYQYSVYEYELYPLRANGISLKPLNLSFNVSSGYGQPKEHFELKTSQKELFISSPKGVDGFVLVTPKLSIESTFSSNQKSYKVGDAITWKVSINAIDVPDVLIPKIKFPLIEGLKLYEDESKLTQTNQDTNLVAKRVQSATYLFMKDGNFTLPAQKMEWYNINTSKLESENTQSYSFEVIAKVKEVPAQENNDYVKIAYVLIGIIVTFLLTYLLIIYNKKRDKNAYALEKRINPK